MNLILASFFEQFERKGCVKWALFLRSLENDKILQKASAEKTRKIGTLINLIKSQLLGQLFFYEKCITDYGSGEGERERQRDRETDRQRGRETKREPQPQTRLKILSSK